MAITVTMPQLGESVTEGTVGRWLKNVGDRVEKYDPLLEVISDKVDTEITATDAGTLLEIIVPEGETVPVGTPLCRIGAEGEADSEGDAAALEAAPEAAPEPAPTPEPEPEPASPPAAPPEEEPVIEGELVEEGSDDAPRDMSRSMSPVVARMVSEHGLDIRKIKGTGRDGRVSKSDVEAYLAQQRAPERPAAPTPSRAATTPVTPPPVTPPPAPAAAATQPPRPAPTPPATPTQPTTPSPALRPAAPVGQPGEIMPLTNMRRRIAEHMVNAKRTAPHVTTVFEADLSAISAHRDANKGDFAARGARLTFMAYFVEAIGHALRTHTLANATFVEEGIQLFRDINIGMAVATEGGAGLLVPVIKRVDEKNLLGLARDVWDLTQRARGGSLTPDDMSGGTFTVTNHGVSGSLWGTPIINQGQAGIVGIGKIQKRVIVTADDAIAIRPMVYLSFTFDHRVLDGASADAFMADVIAYLESYA